MNNSIFSINYQQLSTMLTPQLLRNPAFDSWTTALNNQSQIDNNLFVDYITGSTYSVYNPFVFYSPGNRVIFNNNGGDLHNGIFENISSSIGQNPFNTNKWLKVNPNYIAAEERVLYNSQKIVLEYALNRNYQILPIINDPTTWSGANHTDQIYIGTNDVVEKRFLMASGGTYSSSMSKTGEIIFLNGGQWMGSTYSYVAQYEFTVWVPNLLYYPLITNTNVYNYTKNFVIAGIQFSVSGY